MTAQRGIHRPIGTSSTADAEPGGTARAVSWPAARSCRVVKLWIADPEYWDVSRADAGERTLFVGLIPAKQLADRVPGVPNEIHWRLEPGESLAITFTNRGSETACPTFMLICEDTETDAERGALAIEAAAEFRALCGSDGVDLEPVLLGAPVADPQVPADRCPTCGWPLAATRDDGCVAGDCSMRPVPSPTYAERMAAAPDEQTASLTLRVGPRLFAFDSWQQWADKAQSWYAQCGAMFCDTVALDARGRICARGSQFTRARDDGAFPVTVYRINEEVPCG